jgi:hypothetical protein
LEEKEKLRRSYQRRRVQGGGGSPVCERGKETREREKRERERERERERKKLTPVQVFRQKLTPVQVFRQSRQPVWRD